MAISRRDARRPEAAALAGSSDPARQAPASRFDRKLAWRLIRLGVLRHMLRSPRFYERVAVGVIALVALKGLGQENSASTAARLAAWNKREIARLERKIKH